jgi:hypothetical protein
VNGNREAAVRARSSSGFGDGVRRGDGSGGIVKSDLKAGGTMNIRGVAIALRITVVVVQPPTYRRGPERRQPINIRDAIPISRRAIGSWPEFSA